MVCRVCLKDADIQASIKIFDVSGLAQRIADILQKHLWFRPFPNDPISDIVCQACWCKLYDFHQFYETVEEAHRLYNQQHGLELIEKANTELSHPVQLVETVYNVKREDTLEDIWQTEIVTKVKSDDPVAVNPLYEPEVAQPIEVKSEMPESDNLVETSLKSVSEADGYSSDDSEECDDDNASEDSDFVVEKSPSPSPIPSPTCSKGVRTRKRAKETVSSIAKKPKSYKIAKKSTTTTSKKHCWTTPRDDEMVSKHLPLNCELCGFIVETYTQMIKHFRVSHVGTRPYILCCGRKLSKRQRVVQHAYHHEDPNYFKCDICKKNFSDNYVLRSHMLAHHPAEEELTYQCDQCDKRFSRRYLLQLHKPAHIPVDERKFICTKCPTPKAFASDHLRQIHDNMRHKRATNVCHVCAKEIRDNQAFEKHVRLHFEDSGPRVKCPRPGCDRWLKDDDNLKQHLRRHNDEGKIIKCEQCGKSVKNRRALSSHMSYAHSKALFTCEECKKTFKKAITLKEHMAQHTGETLYKCPFCPRTFNSNANMHSHKKKMHPVEWDVWRKTKTGSSQHPKSNQQVLDAVASSHTQLQNVPQLTENHDAQRHQQLQQQLLQQQHNIFLQVPGSNIS